MFTAVTTKKITVYMGNNRSFTLDEGTVVYIQAFSDDSNIGTFGANSFDIEPNEYVKVSYKLSYSTH